MTAKYLKVRDKLGFYCKPASFSRAKGKREMEVEFDKTPCMIEGKETFQFSEV